MKIAMLTPNLPPRRCGVGDTAHRLAHQLEALGHPVMLLACAGGVSAAGEGPRRVLVPGKPWHHDRAAELARLVGSSGAQLLHYHYVPFLYGERGLSLGAAVLPALTRRAGVPVVTTLHELAMPWSASPGSFAAAALQRVQLALLVCGSDAAIVTTGHRHRKLRRWFPWRASRLYQVPVGATIDAEPAAGRAAVRAELGLSDEVVLGFFGTAHPSKDLGLAARCLQALSDEGVEGRLLCIGVESRELQEAAAGLGSGLQGIEQRSICTGWVPAPRVSHLLTAVDLFLQPLVDGISTLRTSTMVALAHGLAVVGMAGRETEAELFGAGGVHLVAAGDRAAFCRAVVALARDSGRRGILGAEARALYQRSFAWPRLVEAHLAVYRAAVGGA